MRLLQSYAGRCLVVTLGVLLVSSVVGGGQQPTPVPPGPAITTSYLMVADLDEAERFYHQLLGLESPDGDPRARLGYYPTRPLLEDLYAISGRIRNFYLRVPITGPTVEPIQWSDAKGKRLNPRIQDPAATRLVFSVLNIDALTTRLKQGGAKVVTRGGTPITLSAAGSRRRVIVFEDFSGFFVELVQNEPVQMPQGNAPPTYYINGAEIALTVADLETSAKFYGDVFGLKVTIDDTWRSEADQLQAWGMKGAQYREARVAMPERTPQLRLVEFRNIERVPLTPLNADPGATLLRIQVNDDMDTVMARVRSFPEANIMNVSQKPAVNGQTLIVHVRAPGGTYLQIVAPVVRTALATP